jgi:hypothetical protein
MRQDSSARRGSVVICRGKSSVETVPAAALTEL